MNVLSRIRAEHIAEMQRTLPDVYAASEHVVQSVFDVPGMGKVRFTCARKKYRPHKSTNWFWTARKPSWWNDAFAKNSVFAKIALLSQVAKDAGSISSYLPVGGE
jgi:hypothetical protein